MRCHSMSRATDLSRPRRPPVSLPDGGRKALLGGCLVLILTAALPATAADFDDDFTGATLRVDLAHTGHAALELVALETIRVEGPWPGSRTQLLDTSNLGKYLFEIVDLSSQTMIYSRGFASIFGEWETTGAAHKGELRTVSEALRLPEPQRPFQLRLRKRGADQAFREIWTTTVDPTSRFVNRAPVVERSVWSIADNGDPAVKVDLLLLGDGYTADEMDKFHDDARRASAALFAVEPFRQHSGDFNVRAIDSPSTTSGVSRPRSSEFHDSALGTSYNSFDSERYVLIQDDSRWRDVAAAAPYDFVIILLNSHKYGGGGIYQLYSTAAIDSSFSDYLVVHEFGHHFAGLADEYYTSDVAYEGAATEHVEPWEVNATALAEPSRLKWRHLVEAETPLPTPWSKEAFESASLAVQEKRRALRAAGAAEEELEALFDKERDELTELLAREEFAGRVGAFEGAAYEAHGLYRPAADCIMFTRDEVGFCPVCSWGIEQVIAQHTK